MGILFGTISCRSKSNCYSPGVYQQIGAPARLGDVKIFAPFILAHPCSPMLTECHSPLPTTVLVCPIQSPLRVHFWSLARTAEMGSYDVVAPGLYRTRRQVYSHYNSGLSLSCPPAHFLKLSFFPLLSNFYRVLFATKYYKKGLRKGGGWGGG